MTNDGISDDFYATFLALPLFQLLLNLTAGKGFWIPHPGYRLANQDIIRQFFAYPIKYPEPESIVHILKLGNMSGGSFQPICLNVTENSLRLLQIKSIRYMEFEVCSSILIAARRN